MTIAIVALLIFAAVLLLCAGLPRRS